jgi:four helix bundle protein
MGERLTGNPMAYVTHFKELRVYRLAFDAAMRIFELSKKWPSEERFSLTDQIRRSSRSVCGQIAEAWRKRRYPNHFTSKLSDADGEVAETQNWLEFALACAYLTPEQHRELWAMYEQVARGLVGMMSHADTWCGPSSLLRDDVAEYATSSEE